MKKQILFTLISLVLILNSCGTTQNKSTNLNAYYKQAVDLSKVIYQGGDGRSIETAIIIKNAGNEGTGIASEYDYIAKKHGQRSTAWKAVMQSTQYDKGKTFDLIHIVLIPSNEKITYYFDITDFYGKF